MVEKAMGEKGELRKRKRQLEKKQTLRRLKNAMKNFRALMPFLEELKANPEKYPAEYRATEAYLGRVLVAIEKQKLATERLEKRRKRLKVVK